MGPLASLATLEHRGLQDQLEQLDQLERWELQGQRVEPVLLVILGQLVVLEKLELQEVQGLPEQLDSLEKQVSLALMEKQVNQVTWVLLVHRE